MQQILSKFCSSDAPHGSIECEEHTILRHKYAGASPTTLTSNGELPQAWLQLLRSFEDESSRSIFIGSEDLPSDFQADQRDVLRDILARRESGLDSITIGDVSSAAARLIAEALQGTSRIGQLNFTGARADDALGKLLGTLLRPVWVKHPSLRCLVIANHVRNMLTDKGAVAIAQALEENMCLQTLVLFGTLMGDDAARALTSALERNTMSQLQVLVFYGKALSGKGTAAFGKSIKAANFGLRELVVGGSEFTGEDAQALVRDVVDRKNVDTSLSLQSFGLLNVNLGDASVPAFSALATCGLAEVSILAGGLSDKGAIHVACQAFGLRRAPHKSNTEEERPFPSLYEEREPLEVFRLATSFAGNVAIKDISHAWLEGNAPGSCELAFGSATTDVCEEKMKEINASDALERACALRSAASSSTPQPTSAGGGINPGHLGLEPAETGCGWLWNSPTRMRGEDGEALQTTKMRMMMTSDIPSYLEEVLFPRLMLRTDNGRDLGRAQSPRDPEKQTI